MKLRLLLVVLFAALVPLWMTGCGTLRTYPGPRLAAERVARIAPGPSDFAMVVIDSVNGLPLNLLQDRAEVLPGPQSLTTTIILDYAGRAYTAHQEVEFAAEPGREYTLQADWFLYGPRIRVEDERGELVGQSLTPPKRGTTPVLRRSKLILDPDPFEDPGQR